MFALVMVVGAAAALAPPFVTAALDELVRAASDTCEALPLEMLFSWPSVPDLNVFEFTNDGKRSYKVIKAHNILRGRLPNNLIIYIPGWWNTPTDESSKTLVSSLLTKNPLVLVIDTRQAFGLGYVASASKVNVVSQSLFKFISNLYKNGYPLSSIHLIGFSLGAHVAGIAGKLVQKRLQGKLMRITALDPARPCFGQRSQYRLHKDDAKFVHVIHTSSGVVGIEEPLGHLDVYVNGLNIPHPECEARTISLECDHALAWRLYSASVVDERALIGRQCWNWNELKNAMCSGNKSVVGYNSSPTTRGIFFHKTARRDSKQQQLSVFNPFDINSWLGR